ncbi:MAG: hypothetical protein Q7R33_01930 [Nitrosarchaeum sp.]|nr:hypothetical protein [Nitrosarchaeum sp.]
MNDKELPKWVKTEKLGIQTNILEPVFDALKQVLNNEKDQLVQKLTMLKRLGVINMSKAELDKKLEEIKLK